MSEQLPSFYEFDVFRVDVQKRVLLRADDPVQLSPKVFDTLLVFVRNSGRILDKDELMSAVWPDTVVEENNLSQNVSTLRKILGERRSEHRFVVTVPGRGYRFVAEVQESSPPAVNAQPQLPQNGHDAAQDSLTEKLDETTEELESVRERAPVFPSISRRWRWSLTALLIAGLLVVALSMLPRPHTFSESKPPASTKEVNSIAVLPFKSLDSGAGDAYMGSGMADALITRLSNTRQITVRSTSAVLRYTGQATDPLVAGRELNVDSVLDGKIQRANDRVRVTVQLIRTRDGAPLWAATFDEKFTDIFAMQDSISEQVLQALNLKLDGEDRERLQRRYTSSFEAAQANAKAHYFMNRGTKEGLSKGIEYFQQAIALDPNYALAYAAMADCYTRMNSVGVSPAESLLKGKAVAIKALEIDDTVGYAHSILGRIAFSNWDFVTAEREYKRAREVVPTLTHQWYAFYLLVMNRPAEADLEIKRFADAQPNLLGGNNAFALYYYFKKEYGTAEEQTRRTLEMDVKFAPTHQMLGLLYEQKGMYREAAAEFRKAIELSGGNIGVAALGHVLATRGRRTEARGTLAKLAERSKKEYVSPYDAALIYAGLNEKDAAIAQLEKAYAEGTLPPAYLRFDPRLDNLRSETRFQDFLRRFKL